VYGKDGVEILKSKRNSLKTKDFEEAKLPNMNLE
jgi:hypothetical protein